MKAPLLKDRDFATIFLGGGTPSLLTPLQVERILEAVLANYTLRANLEISMEINPATLKLQGLMDLKKAGVNRLSVGVQSFCEQDLKVLGRIHGEAEVNTIMTAIDQAGINNFNIDLIYGIPGQTLDCWQENLNKAINYNPNHIAAYLLQLDSHTPMANKIEEGLMQLTGEDVESAMYYNAIDYLSRCGFEHYEISNFAREGCECRHNLLYWETRDYLGIGAGAVSLINGKRTINSPPVERYMDTVEKGYACEEEVLEIMNKRELLADAVIMGLRMTDGIDRHKFISRFGIDIIEEYHDILEDCAEIGLLKVEKDRIFLTRRGYFLSNQVFYRFIT